MKIFLINPPIREWAKPNVFPLGLGYIAAVLLQEGHDIEVLDINAFRYQKAEVEEKIKDAVFDIAGIGGIVTTYKYIKWLVQVIKKYHPDKKIIVGGSVASSIPEIMLLENPVDIICNGEGEATIKDLIICLEQGGDISKVKGIWYKDTYYKIHQNGPRQPIKDINTIPFPAWHKFPMDIYLKNPVGAVNKNKWLDGTSETDVPLSMNIFASRGCPYQCIYCYHDFMGQHYRHRSAENIMEEIKVLYERYRVPYFHFIDDEFVVDKEFVLNFCRLIKAFSQEVKQKITWGCSGRVNLMTEELIAKMAEAGCIAIGYGIESGSQKMLDFIRKGVTVEQAKNAIRLTKKYLGWADCSFMIGYPGETQETIRETIDFCKELELAPEVIFFLTPYPGTELYQIALQQGRIKDEEAYVLGLGEQGENVRVNFTNFSDRELCDIQFSLIRDLKAWNTLKHN